jgi:hypothetical protein
VGTSNAISAAVSGKNVIFLNVASLAGNEPKILVKVL